MLFISWFVVTFFGLPPLLPLQQILDLVLAFALFSSTTLGGKGRCDGHLLRALSSQLVETSPLVDVGNAPLLKVLDPSRGAVTLEIGRGLGAGLLGSAGVLVGVDDVVGVQAVEVGVARGPAHGALLAIGDRGAGADGVAARVGGEGPHCERRRVKLREVGSVVWCGFSTAGVNWRRRKLASSSGMPREENRRRYQRRMDQFPVEAARRTGGCCGLRSRSPAAAMMTDAGEKKQPAAESPGGERYARSASASHSGL